MDRVEYSMLLAEAHLFAPRDGHRGLEIRPAVLSAGGEVRDHATLTDSTFAEHNLLAWWKGGYHPPLESEATGPASEPASPCGAGLVPDMMMADMMAGALHSTDQDVGYLVAKTDGSSSNAGRREDDASSSRTGSGRDGGEVAGGKADGIEPGKVKDSDSVAGKSNASSSCPKLVAVGRNQEYQQQQQQRQTQLSGSRMSQLDGMSDTGESAGQDTAYMRGKASPTPEASSTGPLLKVLFTSARDSGSNIWPLPLEAHTLDAICNEVGIPNLFVRAICRQLPLATRFEDFGGQVDDMEYSDDDEDDDDEDDGDGDGGVALLRRGIERVSSLGIAAALGSVTDLVGKVAGLRDAGLDGAAAAESREKQPGAAQREHRTIRSYGAPELDTAEESTNHHQDRHRRRGRGTGTGRTGLMLRSNLGNFWQYALAISHDASTNCTHAVFLGLQQSEITSLVKSIRSSMSMFPGGVVRRGKKMSRGGGKGRSSDGGRKASVRLPALLSSPALLACLAVDRGMETLMRAAEDKRLAVVNIFMETGLHSFNPRIGGTRRTTTDDLPATTGWTGKGGGGEDDRKMKGRQQKVYEHPFAVLKRLNEQEIDLDALMKKLTKLADACAGIGAGCGMQFRFIEAIRDFEMGMSPRTRTTIPAMPPTPSAVRPLR